MLGAHLEQIAPYHWRITGRYVVEIKRTTILEPDKFPSIRWEVNPLDTERAGPPGNWGSAGEALSHAYGIATRDTFDTFRAPLSTYVATGGPP